MMRPLAVILLLAVVLMSLCDSLAADTGSPQTVCDRHGGIIRLKQPERGRTVHLIFTADSMFEGAPYALDALSERGIKASFFFTGNFLRDSIRNGDIVRRVIAEGHYVGGHGDRHILLADWDTDRTPLVGADSAVADMDANYLELSRYGVDTTRNRVVVPSYEWYAKCHTDAFRAAGYIPISPSPQFITYRDYTTPDMAEYCPSDSIWQDFLEKSNRADADGAIIIVHLGTQDARTDKFYTRLPEMLDTLSARGFNVTPLEPVGTRS